MFTIDRKTENGLNVIYLTDSTNNTSVGILPDHGALLHSFIIQANGKPLNLIDNYKDMDQLNQQLSRSYKSAKLSPFVCRTNKGKYMLDNTEYEFDNKFPDGSAIHGLIYNHRFTETEAFVNEQNACVTLSTRYEGHDKGYPFNYTCHVTYTLLPGSNLRVRTSVVNNSGSAIPIADGWHPYFTFGKSVDGLEIKFRAKEMLEFSDALIPTGKIMPREEFYDGTTLSDISLDNCFMLERMDDDEPACILSDPETRIALNIFAEKNYPFLQLYIPDDRQSIAIENLSGAPDCFNNRMGLMMLAPGETAEFAVRYQVGQPDNRRNG